jgi:hypothetical protein
MVNDRVRRLLAQISELEDELQAAVLEQQTSLLYRMEGTKVRFEKNIRQAQRRLKAGLIKWLGASNPRNVATAPVIYAMIVPIALLDAALTIYQALCFPMYRVPKVKRSGYILLDRYHLSYLNSIEKLNCIYCGYAIGVLAYAREISARTEQYWCPIKHARAVLDPHRRYARYADFGDGENYHEILEHLRKDLAAE